MPASEPTPIGLSVDLSRLSPHQLSLMLMKAHALDKARTASSQTLISRIGDQPDDADAIREFVCDFVAFNNELSHAFYAEIQAIVDARQALSTLDTSKIN